jgi:hypothetical protein
MPAHHLSHAESLFFGASYFEPAFAELGRKGAPISFPYKHSFGAVAAADTNMLVAAATGAELPNASTITYTTANAGTSPIDDAGLPATTSIVDSTGRTVSVWPIATPRNLVCTATHATSVVAMTITITGYDRWKQKMIEQFDITATGTSKTDTGDKAFAYVESIAIQSAGNATTNTLNIGTGTKLGLPFRLAVKGDLIAFNADGVNEVNTLVAAVDSAATATTGDVRGTVTPNTAPNGTVVFTAWFMPGGGAPVTKEDLFGVAQYAG